MSENFISDDEALYRRIPDDAKYVKRRPDGTVKISSQAFYERYHRISVDRAVLCENDPQRTLASFPGPAGVVSLITGEVRAIQGLDSTQNFRVDVEPSPIFDDLDIPDNPAHAEICTKPECPKKVFRSLIEILAIIVNRDKWVIEPPSIKNKL